LRLIAQPLSDGSPMQLYSAHRNPLLFRVI